ncbi:hypothetical protein FG379_002447 [Cryptosporidium bovis]|uniref:uncharacterized protein n=1 Tax=Cryptosporidium bovis TaxID=310047 RepID=UPI003519E746|nr:hypothetical protein FG379_002447 [Cryptosporidium bovis]
MKVFNILKCLISLIICMLFLSKNDESNLIENSLLKLRKPKCPQLSKEDRKSLERQWKELQSDLGNFKMQRNDRKIRETEEKLQRVKQRLCKD